MADHETTTAPEGVIASPAVSTTAPAVHGDALWGGPRWIENAAATPTYVETKADYWRLLNETGFTMKDQQESSTGPERVAEPWIAPTALPELQPPAPLTATEAEAFLAYQAVLRTYGLTETLWCSACFKAGRPHGCRTRTRPNHVRIECRCGVRDYRGPTGTVIGPTLANAAVVELDQHEGTVLDAHGRPARRAMTCLQRDEAKAIRLYHRVLRHLQLEPVVYCRACWNGTTTAPGMAVGVGPTQIIYVCGCRGLFYQGSTL